MYNTFHRIHRQRWEIHAASAEDAFICRQYLHDQRETLLAPVLEQVFGEIAAGERLVRIPRIELKIRMRPEELRTEKLPELVLEKLKEQLQAYSGAGRPSGQHSVSPQHSATQHQPATPQHSATPHQSNFRESRFTALLEYLRTGTLPWYFREAAAADTAGVLAETAVAGQEVLCDYLSTRRELPAFYFRLLQVYPSEQIAAFIEALSAVYPPPIRRDVVQLVSWLMIPGQHYIREHHRLQMAAEILVQSAAQTNRSVFIGQVSAAAGILSRDERQAFDNGTSSLTGMAGFQTGTPDKSPGERANGYSAISSAAQPKKYSAGTRREPPT